MRSIHPHKCIIWMRVGRARGARTRPARSPTVERGPAPSPGQRSCAAARRALAVTARTLNVLRGLSAPGRPQLERHWSRGTQKRGVISYPCCLSAERLLRTTDTARSQPRFTRCAKCKPRMPQQIVAAGRSYTGEAPLSGVLWRWHWLPVASWGMLPPTHSHGSVTRGFSPGTLLR